MVPFENSTNGSVVYTLDILRDIFHNPSKESTSEEKVSPIHVTDEIYVPINHCLLSIASNINQVKRLYTHPQAWGQCDIFMRDKFSADIEKIDTNSTSGAVEIVKSDPQGAAIAAASAGTVHDVPILAHNISNRSDNTTRFLVFSKIPADQTDNALRYINPPKKFENTATLASFVVPHTSPGALCSSLQALAEKKISLSSINSRPSGRTHWTYVFFIEFIGHAAQEHIHEALQNARQHCVEFTVLGSFPRSRSN